MDSKGFGILALIAVVAVAGAVMVTDPFGDDDGDEYTITYILYGGENSDLNPSTYITGRTHNLYAPSYDDKYFYAWFYDEGYNTVCERIGKDVTGNITLHAKWYDTLEGIGFSFSITGTTGSEFFPYLISGSETYRYLYYDSEGDRYYMQNSYSYRYTMAWSSSIDSGGSTYWSGDSDVEWEYDADDEGNPIMHEKDTIYGKRNCVKWTGTDDKGVQIQYVGDGWIPYYMTYISSNDTSMTNLEYRFNGKFEFTPSTEFKVTVYTDVGIGVTGAGIFDPGETVTLTASIEEGRTFKGWYDDKMELISDQLTYTFEATEYEKTIYALNTDDPDHTFDYQNTWILTEGDAKDVVSCTIVDSDRNMSIFSASSISEYTFDTPGEYEIFLIMNSSDGEVYTYYTISVTGDIEAHFQWTYDGKEYTYSMTIAYADIRAARDAYDVKERAQGTKDHILSFVTYDDTYVKKLAEDLNKMASEKGMTDLQKANFVLTFVQHIEYQLDDVYMGYTEYWKLPLETLFDMGGDCEDTAILFCAIVTVMGYENALFLLPGHMASGIYVAGASGDGFYFADDPDTVYYFCETTSTGWTVGKNPDRNTYNKNNVKVYAVVTD